MDAAGGGTLGGPTDLLQLFGGIGGTAALVFFLWGFLIKDPPLFVTWRAFKKEEDRANAQEAKTDNYLKLLLKINDQATRSTHVAEEALNVAKAGKGGNTGQASTRSAQNRTRAGDHDSTAD